MYKMPDWIGTFQNRARHDCSKRGHTALTRPGRVSLGRLHMGDCGGGGQVQGEC